LLRRRPSRRSSTAGNADKQDFPQPSPPLPATRARTLTHESVFNRPRRSSTLPDFEAIDLDDDPPQLDPLPDRPSYVSMPLGGAHTYVGSSPKKTRASGATNNGRHKVQSVQAMSATARVVDGVSSRRSTVGGDCTTDTAAPTSTGGAAAAAVSSGLRSIFNSRGWADAIDTWAGGSRESGGGNCPQCQKEFTTHSALVAHFDEHTMFSKEELLELMHQAREREAQEAERNAAMSGIGVGPKKLVITGNGRVSYVSEPSNDRGLSEPSNESGRGTGAMVRADDNNSAASTGSTVKPMALLRLKLQQGKISQEEFDRLVQMQTKRKLMNRELKQVALLEQERVDKQRALMELKYVVKRVKLRTATGHHVISYIRHPDVPQKALRRRQASSTRSRLRRQREGCAQRISATRVTHFKPLCISLPPPGSHCASATATPQALARPPPGIATMAAAAASYLTPPEEFLLSPRVSLAELRALSNNGDPGGAAFPTASSRSRAMTISSAGIISQKARKCASRRLSLPSQFDDFDIASHDDFEIATRLALSDASEPSAPPPPADMLTTPPPPVSHYDELKTPPRTGGRVTRKRAKTSESGPWPTTSHRRSSSSGAYQCFPKLSGVEGLLVVSDVAGDTGVASSTGSTEAAPMRGARRPPASALFDIAL
jgi:hypothetical protein